MQESRLATVVDANPSGAWIYFILALLISWCYAFHFFPNGLDDPYISFRYSERLMNGDGLTWNDGEHVEGYSNLLWVLLVAAGGTLQPNLAQVGALLGFVANAATLAAIVWTFGRSREGSITAVIAGLSVLTLSSAFAYWGTGGLETALLEALLAWALATTYCISSKRGSWILPGLCMGLLSITRPDSVLLVAGIATGSILRDGFNLPSLRRAVFLLILPLIFVAGQLVFRILYYDDLVPNTAYVKVAVSTGRVWNGCTYVMHGAIIHVIPILALLATSLVLRKTHPRSAHPQISVFVTPGLLWLIYVGFIGGDIFPYYRLWTPILICITFALAASLVATPAIRLTTKAILFSVSGILYLASQQVFDPWFAPVGNSPGVERLEKISRNVFPDIANDPLRAARRDISNCLAVGAFLRLAFGHASPLLAVNYAGCMPYSSRLPSLDMLGLNDAHIAHHRPPDMGSGYPAHELGDGEYVLSRRPDLIAFCLPATGGLAPCFRGELEMVRMPEFWLRYRLIFFETNGVTASLWTRVEDGPLGIRRTPDTILIPGFLLATRPGVRAVLSSAGELVASLNSGDAVVENVYIPEGKWDVTLDVDTTDQLEFQRLNAQSCQFERPNHLTVTSHGGTESFRVYGGKGMLKKIMARRIL